MSKVLILGGGLAGAAAAKELTAGGMPALIVEATGALGGKARAYGCKATDKCNNCGVCLMSGLWATVENNALAEIRLNTRLVDLVGVNGAYTAALKSGGATEYVDGISKVIVATGFERTTRENYNGFVEIITGDDAVSSSMTMGSDAAPSSIIMNSGAGSSSIIMGSDIERIMRERGESHLFDKPPGNVAFIQCYGSRDRRDNADHCSRVCCAYSSRAAKVIKEYYPDCGLTFFYMEMQQVMSGDYFDEIKRLGVNFVKCRPVKVTDGNPAHVIFDNPETGKRESLAFDIVVLSDGIRPAEGAARVAELCGLGQNEAGFLRYVTGPSDADSTGVYLAGCAGGAAKIEETYNESIAVARRILFQKERGAS